MTSQEMHEKIDEAIIDCKSSKTAAMMLRMQSYIKKLEKKISSLEDDIEHMELPTWDCGEFYK